MKWYRLVGEERLNACRVQLSLENLLIDGGGGAAAMRRRERRLNVDHSRGEALPSALRLYPSHR